MSRFLPASIEASIEDGTTTYSLCWLLTLHNGAVLAFTTNIDPITVDSVEYLPGAGILTTTLRSELGTGIDNASILGVIDDDSITAEDLLNGLWNDAFVEIFLVDREDVAGGVVSILTGFVGSIRNEISAFVAEVRSLLQRAGQLVGKVIYTQCDAEVGDARCGATVRTDSGTVTSVTDRRTFRSTDLIGVDDDDFQFGKIEFSSGLNSGVEFEVKRSVDATGEVELQVPMFHDIQVGDTFDISQGCNKLATTCKTKFNNIERHRGYPFLPGADAVLRVIH